MNADRAVRWLTARMPERRPAQRPDALPSRHRVLAVVALPVATVAVIAGIVSYNHITALGLRTYQGQADAHLLAVPVDGLIVAGSVLLAAGSALGWLGVALGVAATLFANLQYGLPHGALSAAVSTWPAVAFTVACFMLERWLRSRRRQAPATQSAPDLPGVAHDALDAAIRAMIATAQAGNPHSARGLATRFELPPKLAGKVRQLVLAEANGHAAEPEAMRVTALAILAAAAAVALLYLAAHVVNKVVRFLRHFTLLWKFLAGRELDGQPRTNATFWQAPTKALHPTADRSRWHWRPGWHRAAVRVGAVLVAAVIGAGLLFAATLTLIVLGTIAAAGLICGLLWAYVRIRRYRHYRTWERPLHRALTPVLGGPPARLAIEPDRSAVSLQLPEAFTGDDGAREAIVRAVTTKLGLEAPDVDWSKLTGKQPVVTFTKSQPPPSRVSWADVEQAVRGAGPHELMCGIGKKSADVFVSTKEDSPHFAEAMGTGAGKSNAAAFWLIQELMRGSVALILDAKWISHPWTFKDMDAGYGQLPNVAYARTTEQLHNAMIWLGVELQRRTEAADRMVNAKGDILGDVGPTLWIIAEEMNLAMPRLKQHWASVRDKEDPKRSPALDGFAAVSFAGRAVRMHLIVIGQMLTAAALGGGDVRENIGVRMMARYTANSWKMQTDLPMPPPSDVPGRVQIIASGAVREAQVPLMDFEQCRELAVSGTVTPCPGDMPGIGHTSHVALPASSQSASDLQFVLGQPPGRPPGTLTLREAAGEGLFPSLPAARKAVQRRALEPAGKDGSSHLYFLADLIKTVRTDS